MAHILIAEDEQNIARFIAKGLDRAGHTSDIAADGMFALQSALRGAYDLIVLDVGMPTIDGFAILAALRESKNTTPVIMCTARNSSTDTVHGLTGGADDYIPKPFQVSELVARVELRLRDARLPAGSGDTGAPVGDPAPPAGGERLSAGGETLSAGNITLDPRDRTAAVGERRIDLSAREYTLAELFVSHAGQVLTRDQILDRVWGPDYDGRSNIVEVYVRYLRRKLGPEAITTVRGLGYRMPKG